MNNSPRTLLLLSLVGLTACDSVEIAATTTDLAHADNSWYQDSATTVLQRNHAWQNIQTKPGGAKNIILFVGDGMSIATVTAARILEGQQQGMPGEENSLSFGKFPFSGLIKTYNVDSQTADSAGTMTAIISGVKTDKGLIGVSENTNRGDCSSVAGNGLVTALELAEIAGLSTGFVTTTSVTHATPAATYAKSADRDWEDISDMPAQALTQGCEDIASQLVNFESNLRERFAGLDINGIEVMMGGGRRHFLPAQASANSRDTSSAIEGDRTDGRNLITEWQATYPAGNYVDDQKGFDALQPDSVKQVFALFNESHMLYEADRGNDTAGEPSLTQMTTKAIDVLDNNQQGFFLMVESGRIDHGHHANSAYNALTDTIEFSRAIQAAVDNTDPSETLIIVTADHGHVFVFAGYAKRGNPILGKVIEVGSDSEALAHDGLPYSTLSYINGPGFHDFGSETNADKVYYTKVFNGRADLTDVDTQASGFHQESLVPMGWDTHSGEDVSIYATGPGAHLVTGTQEQSAIFHIMNFAANLVPRADAAVQKP